MKKVYQKILENMNQNIVQEKDTDTQGLLQTNKNLTDLLAKSESKIRLLEEKLNIYKDYKLIL